MENIKNNNENLIEEIGKLDVQINEYKEKIEKINLILTDKKDVKWIEVSECEYKEIDPVYKSIVYPNWIFIAIFSCVFIPSFLILFNLFVEVPSFKQWLIDTSTNFYMVNGLIFVLLICVILTLIISILMFENEDKITNMLYKKNFKILNNEYSKYKQYFFTRKILIKIKEKHLKTLSKIQEEHLRLSSSMGNFRMYNENSIKLD